MDSCLKVLGPLRSSSPWIYLGYYEPMTRWAGESIFSIVMTVIYETDTGMLDWYRYPVLPAPIMDHSPQAKYLFTLMYATTMVKSSS